MATRRLNPPAPPAARRPPRAGTPAGGGQPPAYAGSVANLYEDVGDNGLESSKAGFSAEGGRSQRHWQMTPADNLDLGAAFTAILGAVQYTASGSGKLVRALPLADPLYPWLFASNVPAVEGYGQPAKVNADPQLEAPAFPAVAFWNQYRLSVDSMPRPFPVLSDASINVRNATWYPETGGGTANADYQYAREQDRFCTWDFQPQSDYVTMQKGRMVCVSGDGAFSGKGLNAMPRWLLPNQLLTIQWYNVPLRLVLSPDSYLRRWLGRVNQNKVTGPDGFVFNPGELLYLTYGLKPFTPPVQGIVNLGGATNTVSTAKYVNLTLTFLYTTRPLAGTVPAPANRNYVTAGHNLLPCNDGGFRYFQCQPVTPPVSLPAQPAFLSAPLETLWTDPDSGVGP